MKVQSTPRKESNCTVSEMRPWWTSFLMSSVFGLKVLCYSF
uniref:Uncharacterized protein n=1 Tax=Anguilla anguilla TaxID=7936 RepID=A0A0E9PHZ9_ANGAN